MDLTEPFNIFILPIAFGLIGFVEPCSVGSTLLFNKYLEGRSVSEKVAQTVAFTLSRSMFVGLFGIFAAVAGAIALDVQRAGWVALGSLYLVIGMIYVSGRSDRLKNILGAGLKRFSGRGTGVGLGVVFGLNIPVCAAPFILALVAAASISAPSIAVAFTSLALFGFALSLPIVLLILWPTGRMVLQRMGGLSVRLPYWTGALFIGLGLWSVYFGFFVSLK